MTDAYLFGALGTRWKKLEATAAKPAGTELKNPALEALLSRGQLRLDQVQFEDVKKKGGIPDSTECYIKAGDKLYKPDPGPKILHLKPNEDLALQVMLPSAWPKRCWSSCKTRRRPRKRRVVGHACDVLTQAGWNR